MGSSCRRGWCARWCGSKWRICLGGRARSGRCMCGSTGGCGLGEQFQAGAGAGGLDPAPSPAGTSGAKPEGGCGADGRGEDAQRSMDGGTSRVVGGPTGRGSGGGGEPLDGRMKPAVIFWSCDGWPMPSQARCGGGVVFERLFERHGLPAAIRGDNGPPFAQVQGAVGTEPALGVVGGLGIDLERGRPAQLRRTTGRMSGCTGTSVSRTGTPHGGTGGAGPVAGGVQPGASP